MANWTYDPTTHEYRSSTGQRLDAAAQRNLRREFAAQVVARVQALAARLASEELTVTAWEEAMAAEVEGSYLAQGLLGRGGVNAASAADLARLTEAVVAQQDYLTGFAADLQAAETITEAGVAARAALYVAAGNAAFEAGRQASYAGLVLEQVPGDGNTSCLVNCACSLDIQETDTGWEVTWQLGEADHCPDCVALAAEWQPLQVSREENRRRGRFTPVREILAAGAHAEGGGYTNGKGNGHA